MSASSPKNGPLSGMLLPGATAAIVLPLAFASPSFRAHFAHPLSPELLWIFFASAALMAVHKLESFWLREYDACPVYLTAGEASWASNPRKVLFMSFVPTFLGMLGFAFLAFLGPPWHLIILTVWLGQGAHELHHLAKSAARRRIYPGAFTSLPFVVVMCFGLFPLWHDAVLGERGLVFYGFFAALPCLLLAFYLEDRRWLARAVLPNLG